MFSSHNCSSFPNEIQNNNYNNNKGNWDLLWLQRPLRLLLNTFILSFPQSTFSYCVFCHIFAMFCWIAQKFQIKLLHTTQTQLSREAAKAAKATGTQAQVGFSRVWSGKWATELHHVHGQFASRIIQNTHTRTHTYTDSQADVQTLSVGEGCWTLPNWPSAWLRSLAEYVLFLFLLYFYLSFYSCFYLLFVVRSLFCWHRFHAWEFVNRSEKQCRSIN